MKNIISLDVFLNGIEVGKLALTKDGLCAFEYSKEYLSTGVSISPFELPLRPGIFIAQPQPFYGGFGGFDDSLPDGWGLLVQDRYLQKKGINLSSLTLLDRLAFVGTQGRGALEFHPDKSLKSDPEFINFSKLAHEAEKILNEHTYQGDGIEEFQRQGGSPGGARPKVTLNFEGKDWLVKFKAKDDPDNIGKVEYEYSQLAKKCGIEMPATRLFENKYFGVERFDRHLDEKIHTVSVAGLLRADYRLPSIDYYHIFKIASVLCKNIEELWKIFRLMVFNFKIGNKDDHAKNFAFIFKEEEWHFAPAFDLLPSNGINGYHTTSVNDNIQPQKKDLIELAQKMGIDKKEADKEYSKIEEIIRLHKLSGE